MSAFLTKKNISHSYKLTDFLCLGEFVTKSFLSFSETLCLGVFVANSFPSFSVHQLADCAFVPSWQNKSFSI